MKTLSALLLIIFVFLTLQGCKGCKGCKTSYKRIHVLLDNAPVTGAEVFVNGTYKGSTNTHGYVQVAYLKQGDTLTARLQRYRHLSPRRAGWVMKAYITSVKVNNNGNCIPYYVNNTDTIHHYLNLKKDNALIAFKVYANAEWDMSEQEMIGYGKRFKEASKYLFNATDGQFILQEVDIFDHNTKYVESEYTIFADKNLHPHSTFGGLLGTGIENIFLPYTIQLPRKINGNYGSGPPTFIHELGHFGFRLNDEYITGTRSQRCTASSSMGDKNACLMNSENSRPKFCSAHTDNPHVGDLIYQNGDCWDAILDMYNDNYTNTKDKWKLKSPMTRRIIVGQINNMPGEWATRVTYHNIKSEDIDPNYPNWHLLKRFYMYFQHQDGTPAVGYNVALWSAINPPGNTMGGIINIGRTNLNGRITIDGAHLGDIVMLPGNNFSIPASVQITE